MAETWRPGAPGDLETWRGGDLESWRLGDLESCKAGNLETWRAGDLESWKPGELAISAHQKGVRQVWGARGRPWQMGTGTMHDEPRECEKHASAMNTSIQ